MDTKFTEDLRMCEGNIITLRSIYKWITVLNAARMSMHDEQREDQSLGSVKVKTVSTVQTLGDW